MSERDKRIERNIRFNKYLDEPDRWKLYNECAEKLEAIRVLVKKWDENEIDAVEFLLQTSIIVEALGDE